MLMGFLRNNEIFFVMAGGSQGRIGMEIKDKKGLTEGGFWDLILLEPGDCGFPQYGLREKSGFCLSEWC